MFPSEAAILDAKLRDPTFPDKPRFGEALKFLPISFVVFIIFTLWTTYVFCHCIPLMAGKDTYTQGLASLVILNVLFVLVLTCYVRSMLQHPGTIPDTTTTEEGTIFWEFAREATSEFGRHKEVASQEKLIPGKERKRMGDRRSCKWCSKYKPDRCHHCSVCRMCILKMDHHCPWIYNCVGYKNFKFFLLLLLYAAIAAQMVMWTMWSSMLQVVRDPSSPFLFMFSILFGESLACLMSFMLTPFFSFHIYLMIKAMTTIEYCEKSRRPNFVATTYTLGALANVYASLGDNPWLWLCPICPPTGNGTDFETLPEPALHEVAGEMGEEPDSAPEGASTASKM